MSPRTQLTLHSLLAVFLLVLVVVLVDVAAWQLAATQGMKGKRLDDWMLWATGIGTVLGLVVFFAYRIWLLPKHLRNLQPPPTPGQVERDRQHQATLERLEREKEALRAQLRATPGLERYAGLIGRSRIGSVEDARVREVRVRQLRENPATAKYAERYFQGEEITDAMIAYWEDPSARILCAHLAKFEADVRKAYPRAFPQDARTLFTMLGFDFEKLQRRYGLGPPVTFWREPDPGGRASDFYDGNERVECTEHGCVAMGSVFLTKFPP